MVDGGQRVIDFLRETFSVKELRRIDRPDGSIIHAEVCIDDTVIMIRDGGDQFPSVPSNLHVYVPDVNVTYGELLPGGVSVQEPHQDKSDKRAGVRDPGGNTWWIATQVE